MNHRAYQADVVDSFHVVPEPLVHFVAGGVAGGVGAFVSYPFDYIKSQMQTDAGRQKYGNGFNAFVSTAKEDPGLLYKGVGVQVLGIAPEKAIKLGVNDNLQTIFTTQIGSFPLWAQVVAGCCAGLCQVVVTSPIEVIKMTLQLSNATSVRDAYEKVGGVPGLFRGSQACVVRDVLWTAVCFPLYHCWSQVMPALLAGGASGMLASGLATPPDFVKTRMVAQYAQQVPRLVEDFEEIIDSPLLLAQKIAKEDGPRAFFGGVTERMACAAPRFGVTLAMHDFLEQTFAQAGWFS